MVSRRTRVVSWIFRRDHSSRPKAMICCFFSSFKTFAMLREATYPPAAVNVLDVSSESMAAFQVFLYGRFWCSLRAMTCVQAASNQGLREVERARTCRGSTRRAGQRERGLTGRDKRNGAGQYAAREHVLALGPKGTCFVPAVQRPYSQRHY